MASPWQFWDAAAIARITECPVDAVENNWPRLVEQLSRCGIDDRATQIAMIGTVAIETASTFRPVKEAFYLGEPAAENHRRTLRYYPWYGRGYIQITWESNYKRYSDAVNALWGTAGAVDLIARPDDALDPDISAAVAALYFRDHTTAQGYSIPQAAGAGDWEWVRRLVQGGTHGLDRLVAIASALDAYKEPAMPDPQRLAYNPDQPPERQVQSWACSIRAATWVLKSLGVAIDAGTLQDEMVPGVVTPELGLLDARGHGLAEALRRHLPTDWHQRVRVLESVAWDQLVGLAGTGPIALGGRSWYHWVAVRKPIGDGTLAIANPSPGYKGVGDALSRQQFDQLGPFSAVFVDAAAQPVPADPPPPSRPVFVQPGDVGSGLLNMMAADGTEPAMPSTFLPLGRAPALIEECQGMNGTIYRWHLPTGQHWRIRAA